MAVRDEKTCESVGCRWKGFYIETLPDGTKLYCHKVYHDGQQHLIKKPLAEMEILLAKTKAVTG